VLHYLNERCTRPDCLAEGKPWIALRDAVKEEGSDRLVLTFTVDRARADEEAARDQAWAIAYDLSQAIPALANRLTVELVPTRSDASADADAQRRSIETILREVLIAHESTCEVHRKRPGYLFLADGAVTQETGWTRFQDHLLATFSTRASAAVLDDELCSARAVAALFRSRPEVERLLWQTRGARSVRFEHYREVVTFVQERCAALCRADGRIWIALRRAYENDLVNLVFAVDLSRFDETQALAHATQIANELTCVVPSLTGRLVVDVEPLRRSGDTDDQCRVIHAYLRDALTAHERDCELHREKPAYLFIVEDDVTLETGYRRSHHHRRAKFSVDSSGPDVADEVCCAQAIGAFLRANTTADALLWQCGPWK
jgi:hypothetical protein